MMMAMLRTVVRMMIRMRIGLMIVEAWPGTFDKLSPENANNDDDNALQWRR